MGPRQGEIPLGKEPGNVAELFPVEGKILPADFFDDFFLPMYHSPLQLYFVPVSPDPFFQGMLRLPVIDSVHDLRRRKKARQRITRRVSDTQWTNVLSVPYCQPPVQSVHYPVDRTSGEKFPTFPGS